MVTNTNIRTRLLTIFISIFLRVDYWDFDVVNNVRLVIEVTAATVGLRPVYDAIEVAAGMDGIHHDGCLVVLVVPLPNNQAFVVVRGSTTPIERNSTLPNVRSTH